MKLPDLPQEDYEYVLAKVLEAIDDSVLVFDNFKIVYANTAAAAVFGPSTDHLVGKPTSVLVPKGYASAFKRTITSLHASPHHSLELKGKNEFVGQRSDGHIFYAEGKLAALRPEGAQLLVIRDITWKRLLESELELTLAHVRTIGRKIEHRIENPKILEEFPID